MKAKMLFDSMHSVCPTRRTWKWKWRSINWSVFTTYDIVASLLSPAIFRWERWMAVERCRSNWWIGTLRSWPGVPNSNVSDPCQPHWPRMNRYRVTRGQQMRRTLRMWAAFCDQRDQPNSSNHTHRIFEWLQSQSNRGVDPNRSQTLGIYSPYSSAWQMFRWTNWWQSMKRQSKLLLWNSIRLKVRNILLGFCSKELMRRGSCSTYLNLRMMSVLYFSLHSDSPLSPIQQIPLRWHYICPDRCIGNSDRIATISSLSIEFNCQLLENIQIHIRKNQWAYVTSRLFR